MNSDNSNISGEGGKADDKVVVEPKVKPGVCSVQGGLLLEGCGKVVSVGTGVKVFKPGDEVTFDPTAGQDVQLFGKLLKILKESEINLLEDTES